MNTSALLVIATIVAKPGKEKDAEAMLKGLLAPTHAEPGCVTYALHRQAGKPGMFYFVEKWKSRQALDAHLSSSHIAQALARKEELLASLDIAVLDPIHGGNPAKESL